MPPHHHRRRYRANGFSNMLKNLFFLLIILQIAPSIVSNLKTGIEDVISPKAHVGYLNVNGMIGNSVFIPNA